MTLSFDLPAPSASPLGRLDPRWKLAALLLAAAAAAALRGVGPAAAALAGAWVLAALARLPLRWYLVRLGVVLLFLGLFVGFLPFLPQQDEVLLALGPLALSPHGLTLAGLIVLKAVAVVTLVLTLWTTAPW